MRCLNLTSGVGPHFVRSRALFRSEGVTSRYLVPLRDARGSASEVVCFGLNVGGGSKAEFMLHD